MKGIHRKFFKKNWSYEDYPTHWTFRLRSKYAKNYKRALKKLVKNRMYKDLDKE